LERERERRWWPTEKQKQRLSVKREKMRERKRDKKEGRKASVTERVPVP